MLPWRVVSCYSTNFFVGFQIKNTFLSSSQYSSPNGLSDFAFDILSAAEIVPFNSKKIWIGSVIQTTVLRRSPTVNIFCLQLFLIFPVSYVCY